MTLANWMPKESHEMLCLSEGVYLGEQSIYRLLYYPHFQVPTGGLGMYPPMDERGLLYNVSGRDVKHPNQVTFQFGKSPFPFTCVVS